MCHIYVRGGGYDLAVVLQLTAERAKDECARDDDNDVTLMMMLMDIHIRARRCNAGHKPCSARTSHDGC